ncbi:MAG TPA: hypothetical protein VMI09_00690 [Candidatus Binataceae bacterium]|nr:hypothetical protein [Candidatus Binataceae bacterium]
MLEYNTPLNPSSDDPGAGDAIADNVFGQNGSFTTGAGNDGTGVGDVGGLGPDSLFEPQGLLAEGAGNLYVADAGNNRLLECNTPLNPASDETDAGDAVADTVFGQGGSFHDRALQWFRQRSGGRLRRHDRRERPLLSGRRGARLDGQSLRRGLGQQPDARLQYAAQC